MRDPIYLATLLVFGGFAFFNTRSNYNRGFCDSFDRGLFSSWDEEKALFEHFGDVYTQYLKKTGRFLPKWNNA